MQYFKIKAIKKGFTLIELLVVITIMSIMFSISIAQIGSFLTDAKLSNAKAEFNSLEKAIISAQVLEEKTLTDITKTTGTMDSCAILINKGIDLTNRPTESPDKETYNTCLAYWKSALVKISLASGIEVSHFILDPWGAPYLLDEGGPEECNYNMLASAGKNGDFSDRTLQIKIYSPYGDPCPEADPEGSEDPDGVTDGDLLALDALFPNFPEPKFSPLLVDCYFHSPICKEDVIKCIPKKNRNGCGVKTVNFYKKIGEIPIE